MDKNKTLLIIVGATVLLGVVGGIVVGLSSQRSQPQANDSSPTPETSQSVPASPGPTASPTPTTSPVSPASQPTLPSASPIPTPEPTSQPSTPVSDAPIVVTPPVQGCKINTARVTDPDGPLNVRSTPEIEPGNIVGKLENGILVSVTEEKNGWLKITNPVGWISKSRTETSCTHVNERINFPVNGNSAIIKGEIIGGGTHEYLLRGSQGQTMIVTVQDGPLPFIFPPNDPNQREDLTGGGGNENSWTGKLPATGDYILQLDSNFRGFKYQFLVEVK